jgi:lactate dehydrogenase-like 2-hydroxyacid dehydrogenase
MRKMASTSPIKVAVLDDYHNLAAQHLAHIDRSKVDITVFNDTLPAFSHPQTSDAGRNALIERLKPFSVLSTMRERTALTGELLRLLPNLKLILATGGKFESWDMKAIKEARAGRTGKAADSLRERCHSRRVADIPRHNTFGH